jgi:hypothetical protein
VNAEYLWWFVILVAVGVGIVTYLALGPVPEIPAVDPAAAAADTTTTAPVDDQSSPVSTTAPGPGDPASTSETP